MNIRWYFNRLRAMNLAEAGWRLQQLLIQRRERRKYGNAAISVGSKVFDGSLTLLKFDPEGIGLNFSNTHYGLNTKIHLLQGPDCERWPMTFSYDLDYKQRDDLGDARTNWEKDRHFDWVLLAKAYYVSREEKHLDELSARVGEWCEAHPFLHGISWTSSMELAIRAINWMYALAFLLASGKDSPAIRTGIINMADYLTKHYSRYSSANNHLLVEAAAIGIAGCAFHHRQWKDLAVRLLTEELERQNYPDGVNKELSLHYQTFGMEAYLLMAHASGETRWNDMLKKEAEFVAHSTWREQAICEFGDDDGGKILDLAGGRWPQWEWALQLASLVTGMRYSRFDGVCENARWLFTDEEIEAVKKKPLYDAASSRCFREGGNSFLRDKEDRVLIGIDHAALGFGAIAAHGHADALSFQVLADGEAVITDPGTFIYHCDLERRNSFRKTINHSTVCIGGKDQSEMLGAFLWGKRAECKLEHFSSMRDMDVLTACHNGYRPVVHRRTFEWDKVHRKLRVKDAFSKDCEWVNTLMLGKDVIISWHTDESVELMCGKSQISILINTPIERIAIEEAEVSTEYGEKCPSKAIRIYGHAGVCSIDADFKLT